MKAYRKQNTAATENELFNVFKEVYTDEESVNKAVSDAKKAFSLIQKDVLYKETFRDEEP